MRLTLSLSRWRESPTVAPRFKIEVEAPAVKALQFVERQALVQFCLRMHQVFPVAISEGSHPFPSRTRKLSPPEPMVLRGKPRGRVGRCRIFFCPHTEKSVWGLFFAFDSRFLSGFEGLSHDSSGSMIDGPVYWVYRRASGRRRSAPFPQSSRVRRVG